MAQRRFMAKVKLGTEAAGCTLPWGADPAATVLYLVATTDASAPRPTAVNSKPFHMVSSISP